MNPAEIEFIAEKSIIEIIPHITHPGVIKLIGGDVGPFRAGLPVNVPLWLAINLKQKQQCRIIKPEWMDVEKLEQTREEETNNNLFTKMPHPHYLEVTNILLKVASDDISQGDEIRTIVKEIWDKRISKLTSSVDTMINDSQIQASLNNLTHMEINNIRPLLPDVLNTLQNIQQSYDSDEEELNQNSTRSSSSTGNFSSYSHFSSPR